MAWTAVPAAAQVTGGEALARLMDGNARFVRGAVTRPRQDAARRAALAKGQQPFAMILSCADSRVPPEVLFDQGLGDLFVVRVAGNVEDELSLGSLEYGALVLGSPLIVVLGHEHCGAVHATLEGKPAPGHVQAVVDAIKPSLTGLSHDDEETLDKAVDANVRATVADIERRSEALAGLKRQGRLTIVGARYDLDTGAVTLVR